MGRKVLTPEEEDNARRWERAERLGQRLCSALYDEDFDNQKIKKLLFQALEWDYPEVVVNCIHRAPDEGLRDYTPLIIACLNGNAEVVKLLLSFPGIIPQQGYWVCKWDPCRVACTSSCIEVLKLLLRDHRIKADGSEYRRDSPLRYSYDEPEVVRWLIASRKPLVEDEDDLPGAVELLKAYRDDPVATTKRVRAELGLDVSDAAEVHALVVLLCDGFFALPDATKSPATESPAESSASRFFAMVSRLPMELQMMTCHRAFDSAQDLVKRQDSEAAFKRVGEILALEDGWKAPSYDKDKDNVDPKFTYRGGFKIKRND